MIIKLFTIDGSNRRKDRTVTVRMTTCMEQTNQELAAFDKLFQTTCMVALKEGETPFLDKELKDLDAVDMDLEDTSKTPSKRLRDVLYVYYKQTLKRDPTEQEWKEYYKKAMSHQIELIKQKLD